MPTGTDEQSTLDELIEATPVDKPTSTVERDDYGLTISIEGPSKSPLSAPAITGLVIFGGAAFICPGVFLVAVVLLPLALLSFGAIYFFAPEKLKRSTDRQVLAITADEFRFTEVSTSPPKSGEHASYGDNAGPPQHTETVLRRDDITARALIVEPDVNTPEAIQIDSADDEPIVFGDLLFVDQSDGVNDDDVERDAHRELVWLNDIIDAYLHDIDNRS